MGRVPLVRAVGLIVLLTCEAIYTKHINDIPVLIPKTLDEVKHVLCMKWSANYCVDTSPAKIIINQLFDFTNSEGTKTELGCYHRTSPAECLTVGQLKLNINNQCDGLTQTNVTYSVAGRLGINVGSNKIIVGENGGGFKGKGLRLQNSNNVEIRQLQFVEINPQVIWGGDAIDLSNATNVLIDGNYIKNIGRQMIVAHFGSNTRITISNNMFDGNTPYSAYCDGTHYWLWLFIGEGDMITVQNNVIMNTSGRGPHILAAQNTTSLIHIIENKFYNIKDAGLIEPTDSQSSILVEGNLFVNVVNVFISETGNIFMPQNTTDEAACKHLLHRDCLKNTVINSGKAHPKNSYKVLEDFSKFRRILAKPETKLIINKK